MLILTRYQDESIVISDDIRITILSDGPNKVKVGAEAPDYVLILRE
jgi:carbon storage regulator CsrA